MIKSQKVIRVTEILKKRFPNLTVAEVIDLAYKILEAIEEE